ncbi:MAG: IclR family transcriptional regulator [Halieaceae bacterium]|nr:IclR family transcriptional regulator [Halieaceae bacterium]
MTFGPVEELRRTTDMKRVDEKEAASDGNAIQSISRAAAILRLLGQHPEGISLGGLARATGLPRSTAQRIINALRSEDLAELVNGGVGFCLGPEVSRLAQYYRAQPTELIRPALQSLASATNESVILAKLDRQEVMVLDTITAERELRVVMPVGIQHIPIHSTASGKALLMGLEPGEMTQLLCKPLLRLTPNTLDLESLSEAMVGYRETGIATDYEEHELGIGGFAVPVQTALGLFSVAVIVPAARIATVEAGVREALLACREDIEQRIGPTAP